jgi:hypothetical protein
MLIISVFSNEGIIGGMEGNAIATMALVYLERSSYGAGGT